MLPGARMQWQLTPVKRMPLEKGVCLLTGSTGGIGRALAPALAEAGYQLILSARNEHQLTTLSNSLPRDSVIDCVVADTADESGLEKLALRAEQANVSTLVNLAGINEFAWFEDQNQTKVRHMIDVNLIAPMCLTQLLLPSLQQQDSALIVNVGSAFGAIGYPGYAIYCASKFGLRGFSEALRRELQETSVDVVYVAPRAVTTDMNSTATVALNEHLGNRSDAPVWVAKKILKAMTDRTITTQLGWPEKIFTRLNQIWTKPIDQALGKQLSVIRSYAKNGRDKQSPANTIPRKFHESSNKN